MQKVIEGAPGWAKMARPGKDPICVLEISVGGRRFTGAIHPDMDPKVEARKLLNRLDPSIKCGFRVRTTEYAFVPVNPASLNFRHLEPVRVKRYGF